MAKTVEQRIKKLDAEILSLPVPSRLNVATEQRNEALALAADGFSTLAEAYKHLESDCYMDCQTIKAGTALTHERCDKCPRKAILLPFRAALKRWEEA